MRIDDIMWEFYKDWHPKKLDNVMSSMMDLGRLFVENDPNTMMLRLQKRLQVHREFNKEEVKSPKRYVCGTKTDI